MKIQKFISFLAAFLYLLIIFFSPPSYIKRPKFILLSIVKYPLELTNRIFFNLNSVLHSRDIIQEGLSLRKRVDALTNQLVQYKEVEAENIRLRRLLDFKENSPFKLKAARIIGKDSSNLSDTILINRGSSSGLKKDAVVITEGGLVGHLSGLSSDIGRVMLITDPNSRISALVSRTRHTGVVYGSSTKFCELKYLPLGADVKIGDKVATSGFSDIYPKGLLVGEVINIRKEPRGLSLTALVKPAVDISRIEEVLCIE